LLVAVAGVLALWVLVALAAFGAGWWRRAPAPEMPGWPAAWLRPVFGRYLALIALALLAMVLVADVTAFRNYWLLPLLAPVPLMAFALRPGLEGAARGKRMTGLALALIAAVLAATAVRPWMTAASGKIQPIHYPVLQLAQALRGAGYDGQGRVIAADNVLAGNLRTRFPAALAVDCSQRRSGDVAGCVADSVQMAERAGQGWLVISSGDDIEPGWWSRALAHIPDGDRLPRASVQIPYQMVRRDHAPAGYDFVWKPARPPQP
jgi:hypothetical protein